MSLSSPTVSWDLPVHSGQVIQRRVRREKKEFAENRRVLLCELSFQLCELCVELFLRLHTRLEESVSFSRHGYRYAKPLREVYSSDCARRILQES